MDVNAYFSSYGVPATGLTPTIKIRRVSDNTLVIDAAAMSELGDGFYVYSFTAFDNTKDYVIVCDGGDTLVDADRYATGVTGDVGLTEQVKAKTDLLPADPASEASVEAAVSATESNIRGADGDTLKTLSDQLDGINTSVGSGAGTAIAAIKAKTDNLPADPASQSIVTGAISTTESNIRGVDGDDLATLSGQLDTINTTDNAIKAKTDNLPSDPVSSSIITAAVATAETNIRGADGDTLKTLSDQLDGVNTAVGTANTVAGAIKAKTDNLPNDPASQAAVNASISATESNIRGADGDTLKTLSDQDDSILTAAQSIQNNTTTRIDVPERLIRPDSGSSTYRIIMGLYDTSGNAKVPDSAPTIEIENIAGAVILAETACTQFTGQDGQYYYDYVISSTDTLQVLIVTLKEIEGGVTTYHRRSTEVSLFETQLNEVQADVDAIKAKTDNMPADTSTSLTNLATGVTGIQTALDDGTNGLAALRTVGNTITERTNRLPDSPANEVTSQAIKLLTDNLPMNTAQTLTDMSSAIASDEATIQGLLTDATYGLNALKALLEAIDTSTESAGRFSEIKGTGWTTETLVQLNSLLTAIKGFTDNLPGDTSSTLSTINTTLNGVKARTDLLPNDPASESGVTTAISNTESNIRGADGDDLKVLSDQLDGINATTGTISGTANAIKAKTDNLPADPASQSANQSALDATEGRLTTDLQSLISTNASELEDITTISDAVVGIKAKTDYLPDKTSNTLSQIQAAVNAINSELAAGATPAEIQGMLDTLTSTVTGLINTLQTDVGFIKDIEGGRWKIIGTQMVFYKEDNVTEVARFNLYDANGLDSGTSVYERKRV